MHREWKPWPSRDRQDVLAYAQTTDDLIDPSAPLPRSDQLTIAQQFSRRLAAARMAKVLAYLIPDLKAFRGQGAIHISVLSQHKRDYDAHTRDHSLVANALGLDGITFSPFSISRPGEALLMLGNHLTEDTTAVRAAAERRMPVFGLSSSRLNAGLQSLLYSFYGFGHPTEIACVLDGPLEYVRDGFNSMAFAWILGPLQSVFRSEALITIEGQFDTHVSAPSPYHPLAGAIVSLGAHEIAVGSGGICLDLASGRLGHVRTLSPGNYRLTLFRKDCPWGNSNISVSSAISWGAGPLGHMLEHAYLANFPGQDPSSLDGDVVADNLPPRSLLTTGYPFRKLGTLFPDED